MKNVLAITVALMMAAMVLTPAVGYSINSGDKTTYSITTKDPAHKMTPEVFANKSSFKAPAVVGAIKTPYSFELWPKAAYSFEANGVPAGMKPQKSPAILGKEIKKTNMAAMLGFELEPESEVAAPEVLAEAAAEALPEVAAEVLPEASAMDVPEVPAEVAPEVPAVAETAVAAEDNVAEIVPNETVDINATNETNTTEVIDLVEVAPIQ